MKLKQHQPARDARQKPDGLTAGSIVEVLIERIVPGGAGLAHTNGLTFFVGLAAPGDRLRVRVERVRGRIAFASIVEIIEASPLRIEPPCPYFGRCGGCDFQQLNYQAQLNEKVSIIYDCLRRIAHIETPPDIPITASPAAWQYRSRAQWQHDAREKRLGYFERGSHRVCDVVECAVLVPALQTTLTRLRQELQAGALLMRSVKEFEAVAGDHDVALLSPPLDNRATREVSRTVNDFRYRFSAEGFFQINHELLGALVDAATGSAHGERALDLYCGAGLFTLPLAKRFASVVGVESSATAIADARRNIKDAGFTNAAAERARVGEWLRDHAATLAPVDLVLLDPPRAGAEAGVVNAIVQARPRRIAYISCDPATLARDLKEFLRGNYAIDSISAFDMFPQTHHVETVAHLSLQSDRLKP